MAQAYRNSTITAVSNSNTQRAFIMRRARDLGLDNVQVLTADMVDFQVRGCPQCLCRGGRTAGLWRTGGGVGGIGAE